VGHRSSHSLMSESQRCPRLNEPASLRTGVKDVLTRAAAQTASPFSRLLSRDNIFLCTPFFLFLGCLRRLRWADQRDHLRAPLRLPLVSVRAPPHPSPFRSKAAGAAPERRSAPGPWRVAPQHIVGTLPCAWGLQVKGSHALHHPTRSRLPDGASGGPSGLTPTSSQRRGLPGVGPRVPKLTAEAVSSTTSRPTPPMEVRLGVWLIRTSG
jgi:hypothetical protein